MEKDILYNAYDVAKLISKIYFNMNKALFGTKLHRILYMVQIEFMKNYDYPCFKESMTAWNYGPVIAEQYHEIRSLDNGYSVLKTDLSVFRVEHVVFINEIIEKINNMDNAEFMDYIKDQKSFKDAYNSDVKIIKPYDVSKDIDYKQKTKVLTIGNYKHLN